MSGAWDGVCPNVYIILSICFVKVCLSGRKNGVAFYTCSAKSVPQSNGEINRQSGGTAWLVEVPLQ